MSTTPTASQRGRLVLAVMRCARRRSAQGSSSLGGRVGLTATAVVAEQVAGLAVEGLAEGGQGGRSGWRGRGRS